MGVKDDIDGMLVGLWPSGFSSVFSVCSYHFHFLSSGRQHGGYLLPVGSVSRPRVDRFSSAWGRNPRSDESRTGVLPA
jgi:hypothetical protein